MKNLFYLYLLFSFSASALTESNMPAIYNLLDKEEDFYQLGEFKGAKNKTLKYAKFGNRKGSKGSIVFVNGFGENVFKYIELFYDLNIKGYSPIYTYDHRGQGLSERSVENLALIHVESYQHYVDDFRSFKKDVVLQDPTVDSKNLFLMAHSMGSSISILYLEDFASENQFKRAAFGSPLIKVNTRVPVVAENIVMSVFRFLCLFDCELPIWNPNKEILLRRKASSKKRHHFDQDIIKNHPEIHAFTGPTYSYGIEIFKALDYLIKEENLKKINIPILILQAREDRVVSNKSQQVFCDKLLDLCTLEQIKGRHEIFLNQDLWRDQAINKSTGFFQ